MRITGGQGRGIEIKAPRGNHVRPTSDKVREALFATIGTRVEGARVLDVFAGTGALGIEALSRGAETAVFVEIDRRIVRLIEGNVERAGFAEKVEIICSAYHVALAKMSRRRARFDIVLLDPPYESKALTEVAHYLGKYPICSQNAMLVIEHFKKTETPSVVAGLKHTSTRLYGQTALSYYEGCVEEGVRSC